MTSTGDDPLSRLLVVAGVRGSLMSRARLAAPYGVEAQAPRPVFHAPVHGSTVIRADGIVETLGVGDVAVLPRGDAHRIADSVDRACQNIRLFPVRQDGVGLPTVHDHSETPDLSLLCGTFQLGDPARSWLLDPMPALFVVRGADGATDFVRATLGLLEAEIASGGLGSSVLADRLVEVLVIHLLRAWMERDTHGSGGWFAGMADARLGRVLHAVHADPAGDWSLATMARTAGMSRTRFSTCFRETLGQAPGAWLTEWRIAVARRALRDGADVARAAEQAGYSSEASFSRAFKRLVGTAPGAWRSTTRPLR